MVLNKAYVEPEALPNQRKLGPVSISGTGHCMPNRSFHALRLLGGGGGGGGLGARRGPRSKDHKVELSDINAYYPSNQIMKLFPHPFTLDEEKNGYVTRDQLLYAL